MIAGPVLTPPECYGGKWPGGAGALNPQWVVAHEFKGPQDYKLLEGIVRGSEISSDDNFLNHDDHDWKIRVRPDPSYAYMLEANTGKDNVPVEWEHTHLPARFRPIAGDRASVWGYRIYDCGHGQHAEIHPPVLIATHRARPVQIPAQQAFDIDGDGIANETVGSGVWVPGVVSDVFANAYSGESTTPGWSHLGQPRDMDCVRAEVAARRVRGTSETSYDPQPRLPSSCRLPPVRGAHARHDLRAPGLRRRLTARGANGLAEVGDRDVHERRLSGGDVRRL